VILLRIQNRFATLRRLPPVFGTNSIGSVYISIVHTFCKLYDDDLLPLGEKGNVLGGT
jgi:hypothetical protein